MRVQSQFQMAAFLESCKKNWGLGVNPNQKPSRKQGKKDTACTSHYISAKPRKQIKYRAYFLVFLVAKVQQCIKIVILGTAIKKNYSHKPAARKKRPKESKGKNYKQLQTLASLKIEKRSGMIIMNMCGQIVTLVSFEFECPKCKGTFDWQNLNLTSHSLSKHYVKNRLT